MDDSELITALNIAQAAQKKLKKNKKSKTKSKDARLSSSQQKGLCAEAEALEYLLLAGLRLQTQNFRSMHGELDLIMWDHTTLVFIEVRSRTKANHGGALASIDKRKQVKMSRTALSYMQQHRLQAVCRFDMLAIDNGKITWVQNAILPLF